MEIDLVKLEAAARAAGGLEWHDDGTAIVECSVNREGVEPNVWGYDFEGDTNPAHRAHVEAANPAVVLALIEQLTNRSQEVISLVDQLRTARDKSAALLDLRDKELARLRKENLDMGWERNPDRMGS